MCESSRGLGGQGACSCFPGDGRMILEYRGSSCETAVYNQSTSVDVFFNRSILAAFHAGSSHGVAAVPMFAFIILVCFLLVMFLLRANCWARECTLAFTDLVMKKWKEKRQAQDEDHNNSRCLTFELIPRYLTSGTQIPKCEQRMPPRPSILYFKRQRIARRGRGSDSSRLLTGTKVLALLVQKYKS